MKLLILLLITIISIMGVLIWYYKAENRKLKNYIRYADEDKSKKTLHRV